MHFSTALFKCIPENGYFFMYFEKNIYIYLFIFMLSLIKEINAREAMKGETNCTLTIGVFF